ncbi:MAG: sel1 repeat family protein, partial [Proteobacteria bacterium]|nr:sel1 repeat family protein [Pseudomonadota bacterium]
SELKNDSKLTGSKEVIEVTSSLVSDYLLTSEEEKLPHPQGSQAKNYFDEGIILENKKQYSAAKEKYQSAYDLGHVEAAARLGHIIYHGRGGLQIDRAQALVLFLYAANAKDNRSMQNVARMYETGKGTEINLKQALFWYEQCNPKKADELKKKLQPSGTNPQFASSSLPG